MLSLRFLAVVTLSWLFFYGFFDALSYPCTALSVEQHGTTWNRSDSVELKRPFSSRRNRLCILLFSLSLSLSLSRFHSHLIVGFSSSFIRHCQAVLGRSFVVSSTSFLFFAAVSYTCTALALEQRGTTWNRSDSVEWKRPSSSRRNRPCILLLSLSFSLAIDRWSLSLSYSSLPSCSWRFFCCFFIVLIVRCSFSHLHCIFCEATRNNMEPK